MIYGLNKKQVTALKAVRKMERADKKTVKSLNTLGLTQKIGKKDVLTSRAYYYLNNGIIK